MAEREIKTTLALDGEKEFKASMDEAYRGMKVLGSEMKLNTSIFGDNASSMEGLTKKGEILGKEIAQQKEIVSALSKAVEESAAAYGENDKRTDAYRIKLNNASSALNRMESELGANEKAVNEFGKGTLDAENKTRDWSKTLANLDEQLNKASKTISVALAAVVAMGAAVIAAGKQAFDATVDMGKFADGLLTTAEQTSISTTSLQEWGYAAQFIDTEVDTITGSMAKMIKRLGEAKTGTGKSAEAFEELGVNVTDINGSLRKSEDIFYDAIDALGKIENATERDAIAMELFGKSAQELNPLINAGSKAFKSLGKEAQDMGLIMSQDTVSAFGKFDDSMNVMNSTIESVKTNFLTAMLPAMQTIQGVIQDLVVKFNDWLKTDGAQALLTQLTDKIINLAENVGDNLTPIIEAVIGTFDAVVNAIGWVIDNIDLLKGVVVGLTVTLVALKVAQVASKIAQLGLNAAMASNPIGLIIAGVGALVGVLSGLVIGMGRSQTKTEDLTSAIRPFDDAVKSLKPTISDVNTLLSNSGKTVRDLDNAIQESETAITKILATALSENRDLRQEELDSIRNFNAQVLALQAEKLQLYRDQQLAELRKLQLEENELSQEQAAQRIANAEAAYAKANTVTEDAYTAQLAIIENKFRAMGQVGTDAHNQELESSKAHYTSALAENGSYLAQTYSAVADASTKWITTDMNKWRELNANNYSSAQEYTKVSNQMFLDYAEAFLSLAITTKSKGGEMTDSMKSTAKALLKTFTDKKLEMNDAGKNMLVGLMQGMEGKVPELNNMSEMTAGDITGVIERKLGINSPSTVMSGIGGFVVQGLWQGINSFTSWLYERIKSWAVDVIDWIKGLFGIKSPSSVMANAIGKPMVQGIALGITDNAKLVDKAMAEIMPNSKSTAFAMDVTRRFNDSYNSGVRNKRAAASVVLSDSAIGQIVSGFRAALTEQGDTILIMNDREFARGVRKVALA